MSPQAQQPRQRARTAAEVYAAAQGAQAAADAPATAVKAVASGATAAGVATAGVLSGFITWLAEVRRQHQAFLARRLASYGQAGDVADVIRAEMLLESEFARRAADRLATKLPLAYALSDPKEREAKVRQTLADEERFARMRREAMLARAIAALTRTDLRSSSPLGAFWKLGLAHQHTEGCLVMAGKFWPWAVLDRVHPPRHYGCLVGGTRAWGPAVKSALSRWYEGQILRVAFRSGREIGITPNHPVLQRRGWVAADLLRVGDEVVCCPADELRLRVGDPNEVQMPSAIEEVARALADAVAVQAGRVPVSAKDFHGDGREGYVDVVRASGLLDDRLVLADAQQLGQFALGSADGPAALLTRYSAAGESVVAVRFATFGRVGWLRPSEALLGGELGIAEPGRFTAVAGDVGLAEPAVDRGPRNAEVGGELLSRFASEVTTDEVVGVERHAYRGHVYNLETVEGWYSAGGIVVHNCTSSLHGYHEAISAGWMSPGDVPDARDAVKAAAGVMMEGRADRLLAELDVRDRLEEMGVDTSAIPFAGVSEAFDAGEHPRDWKGRFRSVGDVAATMAARSSAWMVRQRGSMPADAPSREQITKNWTRQLRGTLSQDRGAIGIVAAANAENAKNDLYQRIVAAHEPDHVVVTKPRPERTMSLMFSGHGVPHRVAGTTAIPDAAVHTVGLAGTGKTPADRPAVSSGYGMAAVLRHEYGHSIDDLLPRDVRRRILDAIPDPEKDLTYYAGTGDQEVIPELLATITHPDYRAADWPQTVQEAERRLLAALGVKRSDRVAGVAAALKRGEEATIDPKDAPALIDALADGEASSLHKLQVTGHPNLFRASARGLPRDQMPQIPKADLPGFMDFLRSKRVGATVEEVAPGSLRATQNQVNGASVAAMAKGWDPARGGMIMVSRGRDVLDGHHRWGAAALHELTHPGYKIQTLRFTASTDRMLSLMREYNDQVGMKGRGFGAGGVPNMRASA